ncbi:MAG TPA: alcohol dehydrogenase catalytic domain-containing protein [Solirubrobacteraceae bacterium]|nr:alcohol dehydrogenase catalytic domain-containing protein [Solirubrobacteraceae bacterium]
MALVEPGRVEVVERTDPEPVEPTDAVLRISASGICGSDLHMFRGRVPAEPGVTLGHEYVGEVVAVGEQVSAVGIGDRVVGAFATACGHCRACATGQFQHCEHGALFGLGSGARTLPGTQADLALIPHADVTLRRIPAELTDHDALFAGDVLATAFHAIEAGGLRPGDACAVIGLGPVGLCAAMVALTGGARVVLALDKVPGRLEIAASLGAVAVDVRDPAFRDAVRRATGPAGAAVVVEAVGSSRALGTACEIAGTGATISVAGMFAEPVAVDMGLVFAKGLRIVAGVANVLGHIDRVLAMLCARQLTPGTLITHELALDEAPEAYRAFDRQEALKVLLRP